MIDQVAQASQLERTECKAVTCPKTKKMSVTAVNRVQILYVFISAIKLSNSNGATQGSICAIIKP